MKHKFIAFNLTSFEKKMPEFVDESEFIDMVDGTVTKRERSKRLLLSLDGDLFFGKFQKNTENDEIEYFFEIEDAVYDEEKQGNGTQDISYNLVKEKYWAKAPSPYIRSVEECY